MERRIGELLDQELLQPGVQLDLVLRRDAGDVGRPALGGGGGDLVGVLRPWGSICSTWRKTIFSFETPRGFTPSSRHLIMW